MTSLFNVEIKNALIDPIIGVRFGDYLGHGGYILLRVKC